MILGELLTKEEKEEWGLANNGRYMWGTCPDCPEGNFRPIHKRSKYENSTRHCHPCYLVAGKKIHQFVIGSKKGSNFKDYNS